MAKGKRRRGKIREPGPVKLNATTHELIRNMASHNKYAGAARFIELAPPGIQFRGLTNIDHITSITFANKIEEVEIFDEGGVGKEAEFDSEGVMLHAAIPPPSHMENRITGYMIVVGIGGQQNEFTFSKLEVAISYYNELIDMIAAIGVPMALKPRIFAPPPSAAEAVAAGLVGADGKPISSVNDDDDPLIDELDDLADEIEEDREAAEDKHTEH